MKKSVTSLTFLFIFLFLSATLIASSNNPGWDAKWESEKSFTENKGQFHSAKLNQEILYAFDDGQNMIYFSKAGVCYSYIKKSKEQKPERDEKKKEEINREEEEANKAICTQDHVIINWENTDAGVSITAEEETPGYHSYRFQENGVWKDVNYVRSFKKLTYHNIYPNIDVEYVFHPVQGIKYSLILHPGADISNVKMSYEGGRKLILKSNGDIHIPTLFGDMTDHAPVTFYSRQPEATVPSHFHLSKQTVTIELGNYDHAQTVVVDPWTATPSLPNCNKVWEVERDGAGNAYIYGGDTPMTLKKYNSTGALQWTYATTWDTSSYWVGTLITDLAGNSYVTSGSNGEISKVNTTGSLVWHNNPNGAFGPLFEYWHLALNCDQTKLVAGGMRVTSPLATNSMTGSIMNINLASGAVSSYVVVGGMTTGFPGVIKEVRTICNSPNGNYYFMTLDSIGSINSSLAINYKNPHAYNFAYGSPNYGVTNQGISAIRATGSFIYTQNGTTIDKRTIGSGAIVATAPIPAGGSISGAFGTGNSPENSGLDIDSCGNVYVGSIGQVVKYDANLNQLGVYPTGGAVYDVAVTSGGEVLACGPGYVKSINMSACAPVKPVCQSCPTLNPPAQTNITCNGNTNGTATVSATGGTLPYTYSWSPSGGTGATASNLAAGTYTCNITDAGGCIQTQTFTIVQPGAITTSMASTNAGCSSPTGSATVTASGGTGTLTYSWSPSGGTAATASGLAPGTYTCTVTDGNGCSKTISATITSSTGPTVAVASQTNLPCNGSNNGSATLSVTGGSSPYTYSWSPSGGTGITASSMSAGTYTCTITDGSGCIKTQSVTITQPSAITASSTSTNTSCGASTGSATATASGGTGALTYSWSPSGGPAVTASNLAAGSYTCSVTDANGCIQTTIVAVNSNGGPTVALSSQTNPLCNGSSNGSATVSATGGTSPYTFSWSPSGGTLATATGLPSGTYTCTVKDASGCSQIETVTLNQPTAITASTTATNTNCGANTGSATATASGGTGTLTYSWTPSGGNAATANNLAAGTYTCTVTDANGCTKTTTAIINSNGGPTVSVASKNNALCNGSSNGKVTISATGGTGPYTYSWSPSGGNAATANNLPAGTYTCTITDASGCQQTQTVTITQPAPLVASVSTALLCGTNKGTASVNPSGGTPSYTFSWSPSGGNTATITGLSAGNYTCTVTDSSGCTQTNSITVITDTTSPPSISNNVSIKYGTSTSLLASGSGTYSWTPSTDLSCTTCPDPTASPLNTTEYCAIRTDTYGCKDTACVTVQVDLECGEIYVPNFFSPNGDGKNDFECVYGYCIQTLDFAIYDRWGEKVFETTDPK
ncbi:MAG TPA: gliding motility-associated C-terminal domain-containing protein, partial [Bacteroidia bacterium]|nr:gliding motility-associated C-terminal domain-containing protein [Bacteroidia bacterium]